MWVHVAVVGAGIIGAALAGALVRRGADVTVLDAAEPWVGHQRIESRLAELQPEAALALPQSVGARLGGVA
jgi:2-polyprenyl-6-methoxyphenol hydroxylase-like FAD-dependent oxidoreductase